MMTSKGGRSESSAEAIECTFEGNPRSTENRKRVRHSLTVLSDIGTSKTCFQSARAPEVRNQVPFRST